MAQMLGAVCKALSDETRLRIACVLAETDACVCELSDALGVSQPTLSNHLGKMRNLGIVETRKEGTWIYYGLAGGLRDQLAAMFAAFRNELSGDETLASDRRRLRVRLEMRVDGRCIRSYGQL
ncbi:MAG: metalloregulator ArsR/SmtB family transcription factor [Armatimonadota bacterium]|nr:metalloregulator ArsR/SmtB family transcription factor [Armatimonadota bacterium]